MPKIPIQNFMGLWSRGPVEDTPPDHFVDCLNNEFTSGGVTQRRGYAAFLTLGNSGRRMHIYKPNPPYSGTNIPRPIVLAFDGVTGVLYDLLTGANILTVGGMSDFALVNMFGRAYIAPHTGITSGSSIYVYTGTGVARLAAGASVFANLTATRIGGGNLGVGTYIFMLSYETDTGFITSPSGPAVVDCFGADQVRLTFNVGPVNTVARWIIASKAIPLGTYNGNHLQYPLYLVHRIPDNINLIHDISFFDENLRDDASYLFNRLSVIPAGVGMTEYNGRLLVWGEDANRSIIRASEPGEPESFSSTSGFQVIDPAESSGIKNAVEFRGTLYVFKQNRVYAAQDNGEQISTWQFTPFDKAIGTDVNGVGQVLDAKGSSSDGFMIADRSGLVYFNGIFTQPDLTYKIRDLWKRINQNFFHNVQVVIDPVKKYIYVLVPLDAAQIASHIIFGDYNEGLSPGKIKWSIWQFPESPVSLSVYSDFSAAINPTLVTRLLTPTKIYTLDSIYTNDAGTKIDSFFELSPVRFGDGVSQFSKIRLRALGTATLTFTAYGQDKVVNSAAAPVALSANPGREYAQLINLVSEQCRLRIGLTNLNDAYKINSLVLEGDVVADERPR